MNSRIHHLRATCTTLGILLLAGCAGTAMPDFAHPGPAGYQRRRALQFDPYPLDDVAPPVVGGRPREYTRPIPEVQRGQEFAPRPATLQPVPWPSLTVPSAPVTPAPPAPILAPAPYPAAVPQAAPAPYQYTPPAQSLPSYQVRPPY